MNIEICFRIYHRLQKKSFDFCEKITITKDYDADLEANPTAVVVAFTPKQKRELTPKEKNELKTFCDSYNLGYYFNDEGDMIWYQGKLIVRGKEKRGRM